MVPETAARAALERKLATQPREVTVVDLASRISISRLVVYAWLNRRQRPEMPYRIALERELGIPAADWMTDDERRIAFGDDRQVG